MVIVTGEKYVKTEQSSDNFHVAFSRSNVSCWMVLIMDRQKK